MKFLHIAPPSMRMMNTYIKMIRDNFSEEEHHFFYMSKVSKSEIELLDDLYSRQIEGNTRKEKAKFLKNLFSEYDYIIWHGLMYGINEILYFAFDKAIMKKSVWIMRGIDLYNWKRKSKSPKNIIANIINKFVRKKMKRICYISPPDEDVFRKMFKSSKAKRYFAPYPMSKSVFEELENSIYSKERPNGQKWIQIGNNAYIFNKHIEMLKEISRFSEGNIKVFVPLSYGNDWSNKDKDLIKNILEYDGIPKEKMNYLHKLMPPEEYSKLLYNMDIAILAANRQNALGNIFRLLYAGSKVYLSKENPVYNMFIEDGLEVFAVEDIKNMTFEDFIKPSENTKAREWIKKRHDPDYNAAYWEKLFVDLKGSPMKANEKRKQAIIDYTTVIQTKPKLNYIDIGRYNTRLRVPIDSKQIVIMGTGSTLSNLVGAIELRMEKSRNVTLKGIYDDNVLTVSDRCIFADIVGRIEDYEPNEKDYAICAIDDVEEHKRVVDILIKKGVKFITVVHQEASFSGFAQYGMDCFIDKDARILYDTKIGSHSYINASILADGLEIEPYSHVTELERDI